MPAKNPVEPKKNGLCPAHFFSLHRPRNYSRKPGTDFEGARAFVIGLEPMPALLADPGVPARARRPAGQRVTLRRHVAPSNQDPPCPTRCHRPARRRRHRAAARRSPTATASSPAPPAPARPSRLQVMAERLSAIGVPVFMADVKGDLAGMSQPGADLAQARRAAEAHRRRRAGVRRLSRSCSGTCSASRAIRCARRSPTWVRCCCRASSTSTTRRKACWRSCSRSPTTTACCCST